MVLGAIAGVNATEPKLKTEERLLGVLAELSSREPIFHRAEHGAVPGATRADFERMTVDDFWEVGASGRRYSREYVVDELAKRFAAPHEEAWETKEFVCRELAPDVFLLTYTVVQDRLRVTRRSTIWQRTPEGWKIVFHQGTIVQDETL
jgi:hypothetical protein